MKAKKAINPAFSSPLPSETRFQRASDSRKRVTEQYFNHFSSPTREGLQEVRKVVTEAVLLEKTVTILQELRDQRDSEKEQRRQVRSVRSILLREIERLKAEWRENKEQRTPPSPSTDWTALPGTEDTVIFNLEPPRHTKEEEDDDQEKDEEEDVLFIEVTSLHNERATPHWQRSSPPIPSSYELSPRRKGLQRRALHDLNSTLLRSIRSVR
ncbi:DNA transposase [Fusarium albosuccineum]|uniref:DNA transposase n=1 Tax=Fusarium albosuccineum TaxID=1237068 RepID=A0A8H4KRL8_9HYPO|nr:DNA transposase [Fusarium albosuccineum]